MFTITSNEDALAKVASIFSMYPVNENSFNFNTNNPDRFSIKDWNFLTNILLDIFDIKELHERYEPISYQDYDNPIFSGGLVSLNDNNVNRFYDDITILELESAYPTSIINSKSRIIFNYKYFNNLYEFLIQTRGLFKKTYCIGKNPQLWLLYKTYLNMLYGCSVSNKSVLKISKNSIPLNKNCVDLLTKIQKEFNYYIPYVDTDAIFVHKYESIKDDLHNMLTKASYTYSVSNRYEGIFLAKKKYLLFNDNERLVKGIRWAKEK